jgi:hypothetical protein
MGSFSQQPVTLRTVGSASGDPEINEWIQQVAEGNFAGFREYLARARANADWQDRIFVLEHVAPKVSVDALDAACAAEPEAADLLVIRCAYYANLAQTTRGTGTSDQVTAARYQNSAQCVKAAMNDMALATKLDDKDPTAYTLILRPLTIFTQTELQQKAFAKATAIAPDLVPAHFALITALSERWGGSHVASVSFARDALGKVGPGSDMTACLFWAHTLVRTHFTDFNKDVQASKRYASKAELVAELNSTFENWLNPSYVARRSSIPYLHKASQWYRATADIDRLKRVVAFTGEELNITSNWWEPPQPKSSSKSGGLLGRLFGGK